MSYRITIKLKNKDSDFVKAPHKQNKGQKIKTINNLKNSNKNPNVLPQWLCLGQKF